MKIYPKIRKYQSGGQLSEVNFYPTVQYTRTSNVAITQGAWSPLKQTVTPDAVIDPELLKKVEGNTNEVRLTMAEMNNDLHKFNSLNEAEKRSNLGVNLLNNIRGNTAKVVQLKNLQNTTKAAYDKAKSSFALGTLAVDRDGNVATTMPNGEIRYIPPSEFVSNIGKVKGNTVKELFTERTENDTEAFDKGSYHDDVLSQLTGRDAQLKSLSEIAPRIGTNEVNSKIQTDYGYDRDDNAIKTYTIGRGTLSNAKQIAVAAELASRVMSQEDKNSIKATALQKLVDNDNAPLFRDNGKGGREFVPSGDHFSYKKWNPATKKMETGKVFYSEVRNNITKLNEQEQAETDQNKKQRIKNIKANIVNNFQQEYLSSFVQDYFNVQKQYKQDDSETFSDAPESAYDRFGDGAYKISKISKDTANVADLVVANGEKEAVIADPNSLSATAHTKKYLELDPGTGETYAASSNITKDKEKYGTTFTVPFEKDVKKGYMIDNTLTYGGRDLNMYSPETKENMWRVNAGHATKGIFWKDDVTGNVVALTRNTVDKTSGDKMINKVADAMAAAKVKNTKDGVYDPKGATEDFNTYLEKNDMVHVPTIVYKTVTLVPKNTQNPSDKLLIKGSSNYDSLSNTEKDAFEGTLKERANTGSTYKKDTIFDVNVEKTKEGRATVNIKGEDYYVVVNEVVGMSQDLSVIQNIEEGLDHKRSFTKSGDVDLPSKLTWEMVNRLMSTNKPTDFQRENGGTLPTHEEGGLLPRFIPQEFKIKPLSLKDLY